MASIPTDPDNLIHGSAGLTVREHYAALMMASLMPVFRAGGIDPRWADPYHASRDSLARCSTMAVAAADALIEALNGANPKPLTTNRKEGDWRS